MSASSLPVLTPSPLRSRERGANSSSTLDSCSPFESATELCLRLREGTLSAEALLEVYLQRIHRLGLLKKSRSDSSSGESSAGGGDPRDGYPAIVYLDVENAKARARAADHAVKSGQIWGPLHGLPITVKEELHVAGWPTTKGNADWKDLPPPKENCLAVQRLVDAGAIVFGKTNVPKGCIDWQTHNDFFGGALRNPYDDTRTVGGSSGGSAFAVACGLCAAEVGGDTAGSVRIPASFNGVYGLCTTYGRIPNRQWNSEGPNINATHPAWPHSLPHPFISLGPITRHPRDLELLLNVMEGPDSCREGCPGNRHLVGEDMPLATESATLSDFRVSIWYSKNEKRFLSPAVHSALLQAQVALSTAAKSLSIGAFPLSDDEAEATMSARFPSPTKWEDQMSSNELRAEVQWKWAKFFQEQSDVVIMPVTVSEPFVSIRDDDDSFNAGTVDAMVGSCKEKVEEGNVKSELLRPYSDHHFYPHFAVFAQLPSVAVPLGLTEAGLPIGVQVMTPHGTDRRAIRFAELLREAIVGKGLAGTGNLIPPPPPLASLLANE